MEFLFQLFNTSSLSASANSSLKSSKDNNIVPLLCSAAEQAYFVIKVVINQLDKLFTSIPTFTLQLIVENYPHKIPKPVRKHLDDWIILQSEKPLKTTLQDENSVIPVDLAKNVTFQSEKDGRSNFPQQTDFHAFCKQRDLFYSIRETWSSTNNGTPSSSGAIISDRNKAGMSFPPVNLNSSPRFTDSLPFKVQSLFQMNRSPTNLFHMASLFVSHYLLEARAQEVGGLPKDDSMKEFFQSNPAKLAQLNSRFSTPANEALDTEMSMNLAFQKQFLLASSSKFVQHVVDRLVKEICQAEKNMESADLANSTQQICRSIKDSVHLARLLGFSVFLPYLPDDGKQNLPINTIERESILQEQTHLRSYQTPPLDLNKYLEKAWNCGRLASTCPWVVEYLLQCDPVTLLLPSYQPVLTTLLSLYRNVLVWKLPSPSNISNSSRNFLRFYFGMLFSSKNLPDSVFLLQIQDLTFEPSSEEKSNESVDTVEDVASNLIQFFFQDTFNRFRRILSWGKLQVSHPALTGEFRHIRPIPASDKYSSSSSKPSSSTLLSKEKVLQSQLEATFFELYPPSVKRSVDFIAERMASNFVHLAKTQFFPNARTLIASQGVFGVRAAEKCRMKLGEEMRKYLTERCSVTVKLFLEQSVTLGVLGLCQRIAIRKAKEAGQDWIRNSINAGMFPDVGGSGDGLVSSSASSSSTPKIPPEDPPFEVLILMHRTLRKLHCGQKLDPQIIDKILACQTLGHCPWAFVPLLDWGFGVIAYQPQALTTLRMTNLVALWKTLWVDGYSSGKIINARILLILNKAENPRDSWIKLGSLTQLLISEGLVKADNLEKQCLLLLRENWPEQVHKRISEYLTIVLEAFHERQDHSESAQVLDWVNPTKTDMSKIIYIS